MLYPRHSSTWVLYGAFLLKLFIASSFAKAGTIVYVTDFSGGTLQSLDGAHHATLAGGMTVPGGVEVGPDHNLYVAEQYGQSIRRFSPAGAPLGHVFAVGVPHTGMAFGPDGLLYVNSAQNNYSMGRIDRFDAQTGAAVPGQYSTASAPAEFGQLYKADYMEGLTFGPDGNLYAADPGKNLIVEFQGPAGTSPGTMVNTIPVAGMPIGLAFGPDGKLYVAEQSGNKIGRLDGSSFSTYSAASRLNGPTGLAFGADGGLYVSNVSSGLIVRLQGPYNSTPGAFIDVFGQASGHPGYLTVVPEPASGLVATIAVIFYFLLRRSSGRAGPIVAGMVTGRVNFTRLEWTPRPTIWTDHKPPLCPDR